MATPCTRLLRRRAYMTMSPARCSSSGTGPIWSRSTARSRAPYRLQTVDSGDLREGVSEDRQTLSTSVSSPSPTTGLRSLCRPNRKRSSLGLFVTSRTPGPALTEAENLRGCSLSYTETVPGQVTRYFSRRASATSNALMVGITGTLSSWSLSAPGPTPTLRLTPAIIARRLADRHHDPGRPSACTRTFRTLVRRGPFQADLVYDDATATGTYYASSARTGLASLTATAVVRAYTLDHGT